ncbi:MAG TPA: MG2 domain-containing protein [Minicystis sp.]|nr:MG2 domain-containing protein [Minicystis sp.]
MLARSGGDWTYRPVADALRGYRYGVSVDFSDDRPFGMAFTDRGIYRPGDTVHVKAIFRQEAHPGTTTPAGRLVNVSVEGPDGDAIAKPEVTLSRFGTIAFDVKVPETGRLGTYSLHATVDGSPREYPDVSGDFEVAEYRPAEFKVSVESNRPAYVRGDAASWTARGDFLFGAPMASADARITVTRSETWFSPPGVEGWAVDDEPYASGAPESSPRETEVTNATAKLDAKGEAHVDAKLTMPGQRRAEVVTCEAEVTDVSRQAIAGSSTALVHPGAFYVALKPSDDVFVKAKEPVNVQVLAVDPDGRKVPGVAVQLELVKRTWAVAKQAVGGGVRDVVRAEDHRAGTCAVTTGASPAPCSLVPGDAGYYLVRATAKDRRGNPVAASYGLSATGDGETSWGDSDTSVVELVPDKKSYEVGQSARVLVKSPWKRAEALVTVERAGVYSERRVTLAGAMPTIDVPITDALRPNAFVSVLLVRGRSKAAPGKIGAPDVGAPAFRLGYAPLPVNPEARRLDVKIRTDKKGYRPGDPIAVDVDVKDRAGRPARAEVTLYAADEGVLSLIGYKTPDPIPVFGAPRSLQVATIESRDALARVLNPFAELGLDKGFDGGGGGLEPGVRKDFRASAFFAPSLVTDERGHVHAAFKLPDGLTTYRVMAVVAAEDDRFGYGETRAVTSRPLMARPALPRFVRAGDAFDASVVLTSKGLARANVDVSVAVTGLTLKGDARKAVVLEPNASTEVRFPMAAPRAGKATLKFVAKAGGEADAVEVTREVVPPLTTEAVALYGDTTKASADKLGDLSAIRDDTGGLEVTLASTALVGLGGGVEQLVEYPYGCTEQLTSRLVPLLPLRSLAADFALKLPPDVDRVARRAVVDILSHQRGDGGFGLWKESPASSGWVTAYALWGLDEASKHGIDVPKSALDSATKFLQAELGEMEKSPIYRAEAPFLLDVLAQIGAPDPGRVTRAFEEREELPLFSRALLLHAAVLSKSDAKLDDELVRDLEAHLRIDANTARAVENEGDQYAVLLDSPVRTSALVLRALLAARPGHPLASKLARGLLADRRGGTWRTTQETAFALLALDDYRRVQEKETPDFDAHVFLGETPIFEAAFHGRSTAEPHTFLAAAGLAKSKGLPISFSVDGKGRLFYEARLKYARKEMPKTGLERGFFVKKTLRSVTAAELEQALKSTATTTTTAFKGGDLVLGEIVVVTPSPRNFVVVDDPLPAGFEAVDARLATSARGLDVDEAEERAADPDEDEDDADRVAKGTHVRPSQFLREVRDDRVLFFVDRMPPGMYRYRYLARATSLGSFTLPPTKAEEMYTPEVFGRSRADVIQVAPQ